MVAGGMLEERGNEGMLVGMEDLKARNIVADENTDSMQRLIIVLEVAVEKLEQEKKRKSLLAEKALKKPIVFGVNLQDEVDRQQRHFTDLTSVDDDKKKNPGIHPVNEAKLVYSAARSYNRGAACDGVDDCSSWLKLRTGRGDDNEEFQRQQSKKPATARSDDHRQAGSVVFKKGGTGFTWEKFKGSAMKSYVWTNNFDAINRFKSTAVKNIDEELMMKQQTSINVRRNGGLKRKLSSSSEDSFEVKKDQKLKKKKKTGTPPNTEDVEKALSDPPPCPLPQKFQDKIREMQGENPVLVIQKRLFRTDVSASHCRLSIPENKVVTPGFLTEEEKEDILVNTRAGYIIEPSLRVRTIYFKRWKMEKETGKTSYTYALKTPWNEVRCDNGLRLHHMVQVWAFRVQGKVAFALVKVDEGAATSYHQEAEPQCNGGDNANETEGGSGPNQIAKLEGEHGSSGMDAAGAAAAAGTESHPSTSIGGTDDGQHGGSASNNRSDEDGQSHNTDSGESQQSQSDHKQDQALKWMV